MLQKLTQREPALAKALPRQPGTKEIRYAHLLSGEVGPGDGLPAVSSTAVAATNGEERVTQLEAEVAELRREVAELREKLEALLS